MCINAAAGRQTCTTPPAEPEVKPDPHDSSKENIDQMIVVEMHTEN